MGAMSKFKKVFLSTCDIEGDVAQDLIQILLKKGMKVYQSPKPGGTQESDSRWKDWYEGGFTDTLRNVESFFIVLTHAWEQSTWMQFEATQAQKMFELGKIKNFCFFNPLKISVSVEGMKRFLKTEVFIKDFV